MITNVNILMVLSFSQWLILLLTIKRAYFEIFSKIAHEILRYCPYIFKSSSAIFVYGLPYYLFIKSDPGAKVVHNNLAGEVERVVLKDALKSILTASFIFSRQ